MLGSREVINKVWELLPEGIKEMWSELPTDEDSHVALDFFRDVLKGGLIKVYQAFAEELKDKSLTPMYMAGVYEHQATLLAGLGLIEVYISEFE